MAEHSLEQIVAYLTVCEILADASTGADGLLWCERSGFCRCGFAALGFILLRKYESDKVTKQRERLFYDRSGDTGVDKRNCMVKN